MNPTPSPELPPDSLAAPTPSEIEAANEFVAATPKTLPLKREATPVFAEVKLPAEVALPQEQPQALNLAPDANTAPAAEVAPELAPPIPASVEAPQVQQEAPKQPEIPQQPVGQVEFSPSGGTHNASVTVRFSCATPNEGIRYALNAEDVDENGTLYNVGDAIFIKQTTSIAARAWIEGKPGPLTQARFEIVQPGWQKIEPLDQSDATTHEIHDDAILEGAWRLAGASVRGKLHAHRGGWREDAFRHAQAHAGDGTYSVVVVSDGAGSAQLSRVGSNLMCETATNFLVEKLTQMTSLSSDSKELAEKDLPVLRGFLVEAARLALEKTREEAARRTRPLADFSATFLILVRREWNNAQLCAALQVGDGGIALLNEGGALTILGEADHGGQSGETKFLTSGGIENELAARVRFSIRPQLQAVAVMTDGVADDYFPEAEKFPELFATVLPIVTEATTAGKSAGAALLDWIDYEKKGSADDRALVVCWRETTPTKSSETKPAEGGSDGVL